MTDLPPEDASSHVRNVLMAFAQPTSERGQNIVFSPLEAAAICTRLRKVLAELEQVEQIVQKAEYWIDAAQRAEQDVVRLRAVGDHVERVYPEAASGTDEDYGSPILPPAQQDGAAFRGQESEP